MTSALLSIKEDQIVQLVQRIKVRYGYDFLHYSKASFRRRLANVLQSEKLTDLAALEEMVIEDPIAFQRFVHAITVSVTSMFRDPYFYKVLRTKVIPHLATYPFFRIWHAGCATGEEAYSLAIILEETGLGDRARLYATDLDALSIEQAKTGIYSLSSMKEYSSNYIKSGGANSLSKYFYADHDNAIFDARLRRNIVFAQHNLACESSFNEFHLILCRNVIIYFDSELRQQVLHLLHDSLVTFGILGLGSKESLKFSGIDACYEEIGPAEKIYKKVI